MAGGAYTSSVVLFFWHQVRCVGRSQRGHSTSKVGTRPTSGMWLCAECRPSLCR